MKILVLQRFMSIKLFQFKQIVVQKAVEFCHHYPLDLPAEAFGPIDFFGITEQFSKKDDIQ